MSTVKATEYLKTELETFERLKPELLKHLGKYVVIVGDKKIDVYDTFEDAMKSGYREAGLNPFLVKEISFPEKIMNFSRDLVHATFMLELTTA